MAKQYTWNTQHAAQPPERKKAEVTKRLMICVCIGVNVPNSKGRVGKFKLAVPSLGTLETKQTKYNPCNHQ